jgi:double-strand break repair protein MRE11
MTGSISCFCIKIGLCFFKQGPYLSFLFLCRVKHGPQESVPEGMFDDSIDLVIWGHEHDCRILPEPVAGKHYFISQPGSSVATSLADGEAIEKCVFSFTQLFKHTDVNFCRHVALLQIQGKEFQLTPIPLRTVRPFVLEDVILSEAAEDEGFELTDQLAISKFLKKKVGLKHADGRLNDELNVATGQCLDRKSERALG